MLSRRENVQRIIPAAIIGLTVFIRINEAAADYNGYKVYQLYPDTSEKIAVLKRLNGATGYDFWQEPRGNTSRLMVSPEKQKKFEELMTSAKIRRTIVMENVEAKVRKDAEDRRKQEEETRSGRRGNLQSDWKSFPFDRYIRYNEMREFAEEMVRGKSSAEISVFGNTSQGREMFAVKLSTSDKNPVVLIDGGIHAREWAAPMAVLFVLKSLINNENLLKTVTFYIVPIVNPDGYEYSHSAGQRFWRKTLSVNGPSDCLGVDANRNFDSHWNEFGADVDPCSPLYAGPKAFSEPESRALRDLIVNTKPVMYLTFHTYGGLILYPWGFTTDLPPNGAELDSLGKKAAAEIRELYNTSYKVGSATNVLYPASGGSDDYAMEKSGVQLVYCIELEDFGWNFDLPAKKLIDVVHHADTAVKIFADYVADKHWT